MASVLLMSIHGDGVPLILRMSQEGHVAKAYIKDQIAKRSLNGFRNPSVIGKPSMLESYDLVIYDMCGMGVEADKMVKDGMFVIGGGTLNDSLELDRSYGEKVARKLLKAQIPEGPLVKTKKEALNALESNEPKVIKPLDNQLPMFTLIGRDGNDYLRSMVSSSSALVLPAVIQDKVEGIEISTEGWFNGKEFVCFNHTLEHKRLFEGDKGPMTGCMGNVVWMCDKDQLVESVILPLEPLLKKAKYTGPVDVNCIATEDKIFFLEFTPRIGYDAIQAMSELIRGTLFDFLWKVASGGSDFKFREEYAIGVRVSMPPYPSMDLKMIDALQGIKVVDVPQAAWSHVFLSDVAKSNGDLTLAGVDGVIGCVTARSHTIHEARRRAYRTIKNISLTDDLQFRSDIGSKVEHKIGTLKQWGWLDASTK